MSRLDEREGFKATVWDHGGEIYQTLQSEMDYKLVQFGASQDKRILLGEIFCASCRDLRRVQIQARYLPPEFPIRDRESPHVLGDRGPGPPPAPAKLAPALISVTCPQCDAEYALIALERPSGLDVVLLLCAPGVAKKSSAPAEVTYYLDQAERARAGGAHSAAVAMYRAALEHLLLEQRFDDHYLSGKLKELRRQKQAGEGPPWVREVDDVAIDLLKQVADGALHTNDGDISRQDGIDAELLASVELVFAALMEEVYETRAAQNAARDSLQAAVRRITGRKPGPEDGT